MSSGTNSERITQNTESITNATTKINNLKVATFQDKTITENGTYTADTDYSGLGTVTVNVESNYNYTGTISPTEYTAALQTTSNILYGIIPTDIQVVIDNAEFINENVFNGRCIYNC